MDKRSKCIWIIRIAAVIVFLIIGIYFATSNQYFDTSYNKLQSFKEIESVELRQGDVLKQTIFFDMDKINSIGICAVNRTNNCAGMLEISIVDGNNTVIWNIAVNAEAIQLQSMTWFKVQQPVDRQSEYTLVLSADEMAGKIYIGTVSAEQSSKGVEDSAVINGTEISNPMVVEITFYARLDRQVRILVLIWTVVGIIYLLGFEKMFANKKRGIVSLTLTAEILALSIYFRVGFEFNESLNYIMFAGLVAAFVLTDVIYLIMLFKNVEKVELYFTVSTLIFGIVYSLTLQPFAMPDEEFHFAEAYRLSNAMMGQPINDEHGYVYMRECDINERVSCPSNSYTIDMLKALIRGNNDRPENMVPSECARNGYSPIIMYLPQAVGVTIGRLLHVNYVRLVFLGRFMNLLMFIFVTYWAIRIIPYGKWVYWAICQIPMVLETVSSQSYDTPILALAFLFVAYLLKLCTQEEKVKAANLLCLGIIVFLFAPLKPVYAPLTATVFLLPDQNISDEKWRSRACKIMLVGAALIAVLIVYKFQWGVMYQIQDDTIYAEDTRPIPDEGLALERAEQYAIEDNDPYNFPTKEFLIENPFNVADSYMGAFIVYADEYLLALFGCGLGRLWDLHNPTYVGILTMLLLYMAYRKDSGEEQHIIDMKGRLWTALLVVGSLFAVFLAMYFSYTETSIKVIRGVQGRYMLPLLITLPLFMKKEKHNHVHSKEGVVMLSHLIQVLAVLSVCMEIWNRG